MHIFRIRHTWAQKFWESESFDTVMVYNISWILAQFSFWVQVGWDHILWLFTWSRKFPRVAESLFGHFIMEEKHHCGKSMRDFLRTCSPSLPVFKPRWVKYHIQGRNSDLWHHQRFQEVIATAFSSSFIRDIIKLNIHHCLSFKILA